MDRRRGRPRRLVLRRDRSVPVPRGRLHVRGELHDGGAPGPRLGGARRPEPAPARAAREGCRAESARRRVPASSSGRARPTTPGRRRAGRCTESRRRDRSRLGQRPHARRRGGADARRRGDALAAAGVERGDPARQGRARARQARAVRVDRRAEQRRLRVARARRSTSCASCAGPPPTPRARSAARSRRSARIRPTSRASRRSPTSRTTATFVEYAGPTARRQGVQGLHVHVGMPDAETCLRVMEHFMPWLPVILALSANSPWFEGERTGLLSTRAEILGLLPAARRAAALRVVGGLGAPRSPLRRLGRRARVRRDPLGHPAASDVRDARGAHARPADGRRAYRRVHRARARRSPPGRSSGRPRPASTGDRAVFMQNRWAASRFGPARGADPSRARRREAVSALDLYRELVERIGVDPLERGVVRGRACSSLSTIRTKRRRTSCGAR